MKYQIMIAVFAPLLASFYGLIPPVKGTFRCDDPSIKFKFEGDTVSAKLLFQVILLPIISIVFITEACMLPSLGVLERFKKAGSTTAYVYFRYWVGMSINTIFNITLKTMASTPRPHFLDTCQPDWTQVDCQDNAGNVVFNLSLCKNSNEEGTGLPRLNDSMKSFPSGHSQLALFGAAFFIVYISQRKSNIFMNILNICMQIAAFLLALFCAYSRLVDHRHHMVDVLTGSVIGTVLGVLTALTLDFRKTVENKSS